ncbi:drug/metabolite transporter (DMT)-like permease [Virgibacillus halotolerans]|uniref:DMT family transporter n=1 Tax=Virgibacillus halotolerans TaxID=1071053 RepID=UPI00195F62B9|nr:DMT family transporter [Virgibacillus halotolerans]MBM7600847.1 drug/metabolite transporter (DMT)-like permease [Virgibacillus halotolerans]
MNHQDKPKSISIPLIISIIAISFAAIFVKWSDAPSTILSMYRMVFASIFIIPIAWKKRDAFKQITKKDWFFLVFSGFFLAMHFALWFGSLKLTTVASSTVILALQPVVALVGGFILYKERTNKAALVTMGIAIVGVMMIGWGDIGLGKEAIIGDILSFLCVIAVVCYLLIGQNIVRKISHWIYSFCVFSFAAIFLGIYNLIAGIDFVGYEKQDWGIFLLLAIFPTIAHVIFNWLLNYVNSTTISMSVLGEPVGATLLAVLLLGERLVGWQIIGGIFVLTGVFLFLIQQKNRIAYKDAG